MTTRDTPEAALVAALRPVVSREACFNPNWPEGWAERSAAAILAAMPLGWCGHRKLAEHELIPLLESCTYDFHPPLSMGDVAVLSSRLAHSPVRIDACLLDGVR